MRCISSLVIALLILATALAPVRAAASDVLALRAGRHRGFYRLVIVLSHEALYRISRRGRGVVIRVMDVDSEGFKPGRLASRFFSITGVATEPHGNGPQTTFRVRLRGPARIMDRAIEGPYRIILDAYPTGPVKGALRARLRHPGDRRRKKEVTRPVKGRVRLASRGRVVKKKTHPAGASPGGVVAPMEKKGAEKKATGGRREATGSAMAGNAGALQRARLVSEGGWRGGYRKRALQMVKASFYQRRSSPDPGLLALFVPLRGAEASMSGAKARAYQKSLEEKGDTARARTLGIVLGLMQGSVDVSAAESEVIRTRENGLTPLVRFLLASRYETEGLYTEAGAYYAMAFEARTKKALRAAAALGRGRTLFFLEKAAKSLPWFERAAGLGSKDAAAWLAGVHVILGDTAKAGRIYARLGRTTNPVALMGLGEMKMTGKDYRGAARIFKGLGERFRGDDFLGSYFSLRRADALLAAGQAKDALKAYRSMRKDSKGEGRVMAAMALAEYYAGPGGRPARAGDMYADLAATHGRVAGEARIRLAVILEKSKKHKDAMETLGDFPPSEIPAGASALIRFYRSRIAYNWISDLYDRKKWLALIEVNYRYGDLISLLRRAENSLRVGEALYRTGLTPDAIKALGRAQNLGTGRVKKKALFLLARLYLDRRDYSAAIRVLSGLRSLSPGVSKTRRWKDYYMEAIFQKGEYREVIGLGRGRTRGPFLLMLGGAYRGLGLWSKATETYARAVEFFEKKKDAPRLVAALTGYGDSRFGAGDFKGAIEAYSRAAAMGSGASPAEAAWVRYRLSLSYAGAGMAGKARAVIEELGKKDKSYGLWAKTLAMAGTGG